MKNLILILAIVFTISINAQEKFLTKTGQITFEASMPSFEEVKAKNERTTAILNTSNGEFAALAFVKEFRFKNALMEEHFNENYAESEDFPKAKFKGQISEFNLSNVKTTKNNVTYSGVLEFHGKKLNLKNETIAISKLENVITLEGTLKVKVSDFDIEIPKVVKNKLSETVLISYQFKLNSK